MKVRLLDGQCGWAQTRGVEQRPGGGRGGVRGEGREGGREGRRDYR